MSEDYDQAVEAHAAKWTPTLAAHRVAAALHTIARLLPELTAEARAAYLPGWDIEKVTVLEIQTMLTVKADLMLAAAPIEPATEAEREAVWDQTIEQVSDASRREMVEMVTDTWTEADWKAEAELLAIEDPDAD